MFKFKKNIFLFFIFVNIFCSKYSKLKKFDDTKYFNFLDPLFKRSLFYEKIITFNCFCFSKYNLFKNKGQNKHFWYLNKNENGCEKACVSLFYNEFNNKLDCNYLTFYDLMYFAKNLRNDFYYKNNKKFQDEFESCINNEYYKLNQNKQSSYNFKIKRIN